MALVRRVWVCKGEIERKFGLGSFIAKRERERERMRETIYVSICSSGVPFSCHANTLVDNQGEKGEEEKNKPRLTQDPIQATKGLSL